MRVDPAGASPALSTTARPAEKGAETDRPDPALIRRTVDGIAAVTGCRRKEARERVRSWLAGGASCDDLEAWLRQNYRIDPTGVTAVRNVSRGGGSRG